MHGWIVMVLDLQRRSTSKTPQAIGVGAPSAEGYRFDAFTKRLYLF
jgi:hypothetical protein